MLPVNQNMGWLDVIVGCMFSGKTEELVRRIRRADYAKLKIQAFKPRSDNRYSEQVHSHLGTQWPCMLVETSKDILESVDDDTKMVAIDEAQFLDPEIVEVVEDLVRAQKRVVVAGLDLDYSGKEFGPIPRLMAAADYVDKLHAICTRCGALASRTQRVVANREQVLVGSTSAYEARCRRHWNPNPIFPVENGSID